MRYEVEGFLDNHCAGGIKEEILHAILDLVLSREENRLASSGYLDATSTEDYNHAKDVISGLRTFDKVNLIGGKQLIGDLRYLRLLDGDIDIGRLSKGVKVLVRCHRSKTFNLVKTIFASGPLVALGKPYKDLPVSARTELFFHAAGEPQMRAIPLARLASFERG